MAAHDEKEKQVKEHGWGQVKSVSSGDTIVVWRFVPKENRIALPPVERELTLASCSAPRLGKRGKLNTADEAWAWQSREHLRKLVVGKIVRFEVENKHPTSGRSYCQIYLGDKNLAVEQARAGWVRVRSPSNAKFQPAPETPQGQALAAAELALNERVGLFQAESPDAIRKLYPTFDSFQLFTKLGKKPQHVVIEQVRDASYLRGCLLPSMHNITIRLAGVQSPIVPYNPKEHKELPPEPHFAEAKFFAESHVLCREVLVEFTSVDKQEATFFGRILLNDHDLGLELLSNGLGRYVEWSSPKAHQTLYTTAESEARSKRLAIWKSASSLTSPSYASSPSSSSSPASASSSSSSSSSSSDSSSSHLHSSSTSVSSSSSSSSATPAVTGGDVTGIVREVKGTGEIVIRTAPPVQLHSVTLSSLVIPKYGRTREQAEPFGFEAHEFLRSTLRGKQVRARFDYIRPANVERSLPEKAYYSVFLGAKEVGLMLLEKGLARTTTHREGDNRSPSYNEFVLAEGEAKAKRVGLHGNPAKAPKHQITDLSQKSSSTSTDASSSASSVSSSSAGQKKGAAAQKDKISSASRRFLPFLQRAGRKPAVIEYVYSADRYKILLASETVIFNLSLSGAKSPRSSEDPVSAPVILEAVRDELHQMSVEVEVENQDRVGNFVGNIWLNKKHYASMLVERGMARVIDRSSRYFEEMKELENNAKNARLGIWFDWDPEVERQAAEEASSSGNLTLASTQEWMRVKVTEILFGGKFYVQMLGDELNTLDLLMKQINQSEPPQSPSFSPKVGDLCLAKFEDLWYRVKITAASQGLYDVFFIDYGNSDENMRKDQLRPLESGFQLLKPQAHECQLAFVSVPPDEDDHREAALFFRDLVWDKTLVANIEYRENGVLFVSLGDPTTQVLLTISMIRAGHSLVTNRREKHLRPVIEKFMQHQDEALKERRGMWRHGDIRDEE